MSQKGPEEAITPVGPSGGRGGWRGRLGGPRRLAPVRVAVLVVPSVPPTPEQSEAHSHRPTRPAPRRGASGVDPGLDGGPEGSTETYRKPPVYPS